MGNNYNFHVSTEVDHSSGTVTLTYADDIGRKSISKFSIEDPHIHKLLIDFGWTPPAEGTCTLCAHQSGSICQECEKYPRLNHFKDKPQKCEDCIHHTVEHFDEPCASCKKVLGNNFQRRK